MSKLCETEPLLKAKYSSIIDLDLLIPGKPIFFDDPSFLRNLPNKLESLSLTFENSFSR